MKKYLARLRAVLWTYSPALWGGLVLMLLSMGLGIDLCERRLGELERRTAPLVGELTFGADMPTTNPTNPTNPTKDTLEIVIDLNQLAKDYIEAATGAPCHDLSCPRGIDQAFWKGKEKHGSNDDE
jgi:hypothetical protein